MSPIMTEALSPARGAWSSVCELEDLWPATGVCALVNGRQVAVFRIGDKGKLTELPLGKSPLKLASGQNITGLVVD